MISTLRRYLETWYVRAFFFLMVGSFVLWGVGDMLRGAVTSTWAAKVAGTSIEGQALQAEYQRALAVATRDLPPGQEPTVEFRRQVAGQALQRMVGQIAMRQELQTLRIAVPNEVVVETTRKMPMFRGADGTFDKRVFDSLIRQNGMTEQVYLDQLRSEIARRQLVDAVTAGARAPDAETAPLYAAQYEKRSADLAAFPIASVPEIAPPDEAAARRWYDNHPDFYATPEYRRVKAIVLSSQRLGANVEVSEKDLRDAYERRVGEFTTIAKRSARVISVADEAKARALAEQWRMGADWPTAQAAAKAADAAALVQENATEREFPDKDLARAVFAAPLNTVSDPIKGELGWFVIEVTNIVAGGVKSFEETHDELRERLVTDRALEVVYDRANKLDGLLGNGTPLDQLPPGLGVKPVTLTLDRRGDTPDGSWARGMGEDEILAAMATAAFESGKGEPPHLTEVQTPSSGGSGYFALMVENIVPAGEKPFEAVRDQVTQDWMRDQRRRVAEQAAAGMLKTVKDGVSFSEAARHAGATPRLSAQVTPTQPDPSLPAEAHRALFGLKMKEPGMVETGEGFLILMPVEILAPDPKADPPGYDRLRAAVGRTVANDISAVLTEALRLRANPRINQENVDQVVQQ